MTEINFLIQLCAAFLHGTPAPELPVPFDEKKFIFLAKEHKVIPIVSLLLKDAPLSAQCAEKLQKEAERQIWVDTIQQVEISTINKAFTEAGIRHLPLKGAVLKKLYPETWLRPMVDYDLLVEESSFAAAGKLLEKLGYKRDVFSEHNDGFLKLPVMHVELHRKLMPELGGFWAVSPAKWENFFPVTKGSLEYRFTWEKYYQYMIEHFMKHWIRKSAVLRDFVDISFFLMNFGTQLDRNQIEEAFRQKNLALFAKNIERQTRIWFDGEPGDQLSDEITAYIFGTDEKEQNSGSLAYSLDLQKLGANHLKKARLLFLLRKIFLPEKAFPSKNPRIGNAPKLLRPFLIVRYWLTANFYVFTHADYYRRFFRLCRLSDSELRSDQEFQKKVGLDVNALRVQEENDEE